MTDRSLPASPSHAEHDPMIVAALVARTPDLPPAALADARAQVAVCTACADLLADLVAIQAAVPEAAIPSRPRELTLSPADAARLRGGGWRRILGIVGSARDGVTRPLALGLTTLGIAGLLVSAIPLGFGGAATGGSILSTVGAPIQPAPAPEDAMGFSAAPQAFGTDDGSVFTGGGEAADPVARQSDAAAEVAAAAERSGLSTLVIVAGAMLIAGLGLFGLRWSARRLGDG
jgi:hypothetical protein